MIEKEFRNEDPPAKIIALMLFTVFLTGGGPFAVKIGLQGFPPLKMAFFRCLLGAFAVGGIGIYYGMSMRLRLEELPRLLLIAAFYALHTITLNVGTQLTTASRSTIFFTLYPIFTVLFGHFLLPDDRLSIKKIVGILTAFGGVVIALAPNLQGGGIVTHLIGDLIVILAACFLALRVTMTKVFVQEIYPYRFLIWMLGLNIPCFLVLSYLFELGKPIEWTLVSCAGLLYQGWIITGFCFMPVSGVLFSNLFLGDELTISVLIGTGLVATGIYFVNIQQ